MRTRSTARDVPTVKGGSKRSSTAGGPSLEFRDVDSTSWSNYGAARLQTGGTIEDQLTPGYFRKERDGLLLPINPYTVRKFEISGSTDFSIEYAVLRNSGTTLNRSRSVSGMRGPWIPFTSNPWSQWLGKPIPPDLITAALADMRDGMFDVGTFLAELGPTTKMVSKALSSWTRRSHVITEAIRSRRRSRRRSLQELMDEFTNAWLEVRYGWRPLYYDLLSAQEALENMSKGLSLVRGASTRHIDTYDQTTKVTNGHCYQELNRTVSISARASCIGELDYSVPLTFDPVVTAWEVVPFSFVFDWFVDVGTFLRAYSPFARGELKGACTTIHVEGTAQLSCGIDFPSGIIQQQVRRIGQPPVWALKAIKRTPIKPGFTPPRFHPRLNAFKVVDLVALANQTRSGVVRNLRYAQ